VAGQPAGRDLRHGDRNEVLDALPVHLLHWLEGNILERGVCSKGDAFVWQDRLPENPELLEAAQKLSIVADDYLSEVSLAARGLITSLCERMDRGALLFIDYVSARASITIRSAHAAR